MEANFCRVYVSEPSHRPFSSSEGLMRIFGSIVEPTAAGLGSSITDHLHRRLV